VASKIEVTGHYSLKKRGRHRADPVMPENQALPDPSGPERKEKKKLKREGSGGKKGGRVCVFLR